KHSFGFIFVSLHTLFVRDLSTRRWIESKSAKRSYASANSGCNTAKQLLKSCVSDPDATTSHAGSGSDHFRADWKVPDDQTTAATLRTVCSGSLARFAHADDSACFFCADRLSSGRESRSHSRNSA